MELSGIPTVQALCVFSCLHIYPSGHFFPHNFLREQLDEVWPFPRFRHQIHRSSTVRLVPWQEIVNTDRHNDSLYKRNTTFACLFGRAVLLRHRLLVRVPRQGR